MKGHPFTPHMCDSASHPKSFVHFFPTVESVKHMAASFEGDACGWEVILVARSLMFQRSTGLTWCMDNQRERWFICLGISYHNRGQGPQRSDEFLGTTGSV